MVAKAERIPEFEALRGALALWVLVGHCLKYSGYTPADLGPFGLIANPGLAVDVFIILSGFVIFSLLDHKHEGYMPFIIRRFFRLFPAYLCVLIISAALAPLCYEWLQDFPWRTSLYDGSMAIDASTNAHMAEHFLTHLTMLHGLVPQSVLPFSEYAIIGQAWSISVEWQFYLIAPLLFFLLHRRPVWLAAIVLGMVALYSRYWLGEGFALRQALYFLIGILSYYLFKTTRPTAEHIVLGAALAIAGSCWVSTRPTSLVLWVMVFAAAIHSKHAGRNVIATVSQWRIAQWFGKISYSVYLWHFIFVATGSAAIRSAFDGIDQATHTAFLIPLTFVLTIGASAFTYYVIEKPGMELGKAIAQRWATKRKLSYTHI